VLAKHRHALVIYGQGHLQRKQLAANYSTEGLAATVASEIEKAAPGQLFSLWWLTDRKAPPADVGNWPVPSAALVRGTTFGTMDFTEFEEAPRQRAAIVDGRIVPLPPEQWKSLMMEEQFDAVLNLGRSHGPVRDRRGGRGCLRRQRVAERVAPAPGDGTSDPNRVAIAPVVRPDALSRRITAI
jgi:hypothetical protein